MKLLLDVMCGGLRPYLRMCGHDAAYALDVDVESDDGVCALARAEGRTVVTRDERLAARVEDSILLTERDVVDQLRELRAAGVSLELSDVPTRCGRCNGLLDRVEPDDETPAYAPDPGGTPVWRCRDCGQCFWKGSHWDRVSGTLRSL